MLDTTKLHSKKKELYRASKKGSLDVEKLANVFKLPKKRKEKPTKP
jgi:hypothetical protein